MKQRLLVPILAGSTEIIDDIKAGKVDFDVCIATPDMMGIVGQVARDSWSKRFDAKSKAWNCDC
jgi:hypothetical protein